LALSYILSTSGRRRCFLCLIGDKWAEYGDWREKLKWLAY